MLIVTAVADFAEDQIEAVRPALAAMVAASRAEAGCREYAYSWDLLEPTRLRALEIWESPQALETHFATPHMAAFLAALRAHRPRALDVRVHELGAERALPRRGD